MISVSTSRAGGQAQCCGKDNDYDQVFSNDSYCRVSCPKVPHDSTLSSQSAPTHSRLTPLSPKCYPPFSQTTNTQAPPSHFTLLFSLALFAFWLRSSVVSVLFSLISEILLRKKSMIKFIFVPRFGSSELAHDPSHCVIGLTLPPIDANTPFSSRRSACS